MTSQLFPPSNQRRGPLHKHLTADHPQAAMAVTVVTRALPVLLAKNGNWNGERTEKQSLVLAFFFPTLAGVSSTTGESADAASGFPGPVPVTGLMTHGEGGGQAPRVRGSHVCKPKKSHVRAGSVLRPAADPQGRQREPSMSPG